MQVLAKGLGALSKRVYIGRKKGGLKLLCPGKLSSGPRYILKIIPLSFPGQRAGIN